jgi:hypothetical protein
MKATMLLKYGTMDYEEVRAKRDLVKQEPKERVQVYYDRMKKLFTRCKLEDVKHKWFFLCLCLEIKKLSIMRDYVNMEALLVAALEVE